MDMIDLIAHFAGGALLANGVPHFVHGISGRAFQTPFASPPGRGESPAITNVLWGFANLVLGWLLIGIGLDEGVRPPESRIAVALGVLLAAVALGWWFAKVHAPHPAARRSLDVRGDRR